jgi:hypothetical protein
MLAEVAAIDVAGRLVTPLPLAVHRVDDVAATALGIGADGAVLVRQDGQLTRCWPAAADSADELCEGVDVAAGRRPQAARAAA